MTGTFAGDRGVQYKPANLEDAPYVDELVIRIGLGALDRETVTSSPGLNNNWSGTTASGKQVFVKQFLHGNEKARMARTKSVCAAAAGRFATPALLGSDDQQFLMVFEKVSDAKTANLVAADDEFDDDLAIRLGAIVGSMHAIDISTDSFDSSRHPLPPMEAFKAIRLESYTGFSAAEIETWRLLHQDTGLAEALGCLRERDSEDLESRSLIHGDMRLDQFLLAQDSVYLTDFEESRIGDPARDLGGFAGEWLYQAATAIPAVLADALPMGHSATDEEIIATGVAELEQRTPFITAFLRSYLSAAPARISGDSGLAVRTVAYAGWHMLDRMLAGAAHVGRLSPIAKAAAGIGRNILLSPSDFTSSLGLEF